MTYNRTVTVPKMNHPAPAKVPLHLFPTDRGYDFVWGSRTPPAVPAHNATQAVELATERLNAVIPMMECVIDILNVTETEDTYEVTLKLMD